jgi:TRAP-type mannitol/chloroaromatic compound transport system permease large subunit
MNFVQRKREQIALIGDRFANWQMYHEELIDTLRVVGLVVFILFVVVVFLFVIFHVDYAAEMEKIRLVYQAFPNDPVNFMLRCNEETRFYIDDCASFYSAFRSAGLPQ